MEYIKLGTIVGAFGLNHTFKVLSTTSFADLRYQKDNHIFLRSKSNEIIKELVVDSYRSSGRFDFVTVIDEITPEEIENYKGFDVVIEKEKANIPENYVLLSDLEKCQIYDEDNNYLGDVIEAEEYPAQLILRVKRPTGKDLYIPFVNEFIKQIDMDNKKIVIHVIDGML